jgi:hypothetical protein
LGMTRLSKSVALSVGAAVATALPSNRITTHIQIDRMEPLRQAGV